MIDHSLLPNVALVDTGVLMRALGHKPDDPRSEACTEFVAAMIAAKKRLLIAAPTFAEMERGEPDLGAEAVPLPRTRHVIVVPFDDVAARELARQFPTAIANGIADETGLSRTHIKYDAMIAACAIRHEADCIVSLDDKTMKKRYGDAIPVRQPADYRQAEDNQTSLFDMLGVKPTLRVVRDDDDHGTGTT